MLRLDHPPSTHHQHPAPHPPLSTATVRSNARIGDYSRCLQYERLLYRESLLSPLRILRRRLPILILDSLENRQRLKIEEQAADIKCLKAETESLKREQQQLIAENGRFSDAVAELQGQLQFVRALRQQREGFVYDVFGEGCGGGGRLPVLDLARGFQTVFLQRGYDMYSVNLCRLRKFSFIFATIWAYWSYMCV